jgi:hypothetical protein
MEEKIQHKRVCYLTYFKVDKIDKDSIDILAGKWYGGWVDDVRTYQKIMFETDSVKVNAAPGQKIAFNLTVKNPYPFPISFTDKGYTHPVFFEACLFKGIEIIDSQEAPPDFKNISLQRGESSHYTFTVSSPKKAGDYNLLFSLRTEPFWGSKNSRIIKITVK